PLMANNSAYPFVLDGRYRRAFNGPGMTTVYAPFANFRINGGILDGSGVTKPGNPDLIGMDEDYDACDLENWFLAIQSADGSVVVPSFHRPGLLTAADWSANAPVGSPKILRPRFADGNLAFPDLVPDPNGRITFDVDNDGDGVTDAVWL